jgi:hypothetical protein
VYGNVNISDAASTAGSTIQTARLFVGGNFTFTGGSGADTVAMDDTNIDGTTLLNMGAGNNSLGLEQIASDSGGPLNGTSTFGGSFIYMGGSGTDTVTLTANGTGLAADFGGHVALFGGGGMDSLTINAGATFEQSGNFTNFETVTGTLP